MTQDEIIRMAMEAGAVERYFGNQLHGIAFHKKELLERFAALVAAYEKKFWMEQIEVECNEAVLAEREACAKVCDKIGQQLEDERPNKDFEYVAYDCFGF